ncbi:hypothetical protein Tco_0742754 [Tanacetum coccineum]
MAKRSTMDLDEDNEVEEQIRQCSRWTREEEILICECWIETFENIDIKVDRNENSFWGKLCKISTMVYIKAQIASSLICAYEAKKEKELAYTECKELEFLMIDPESLPELKASIIRKKQEKIMAKYDQE